MVRLWFWISAARPKARNGASSAKARSTTHSCTCHRWPKRPTWICISRCGCFLGLNLNCYMSCCASRRSSTAGAEHRSARREDGLRSSMRNIVAIAGFLLSASLVAGAPKLVYVKKDNRERTILASLETSGLPTLRGTWYYIGRFDNQNGEGFDTVYPPEKEIDLTKTYTGKDEEKVKWQEFKRFRIARVNDLKLFRQNAYACIYLFHEVEVEEETVLPVSLGSDDTLTLWLNGERLVAENVHRAAAPDQSQTVLKLKRGKNRLLVKVCNDDGEWGFYIRPMFPPALEATFNARLA